MLKDLKHGQFNVMLPDENICGPIAISNALELPVDIVLSDGWKDTFIGNDDDTLWHHEVALFNMGYGVKKLSLDDIVLGNYVPGKTCLMMLSNDNNPLSYHWFVLYEHNVSSVYVCDGIHNRLICINMDRIKSGYGKLACAYEITGIPVKPSWYKRLYVWFTGVIKFKLWG